MRGPWKTLKAVGGLILDAITETAQDDRSISGSSCGRGTVTETTQLPINHKQAASPTRRHIVIPRQFINSMPIWWQADFRRLMLSMKAQGGYDPLHHEFQIIKRDNRGRFRNYPDIKDRQKAAAKAEELF